MWVNVNLEYIACIMVVVTHATDMMLQAMYAIVRTTTIDATVSVCYECAFKKFMGVFIIKVVYNPIAKIGSKHFSLFWVMDDKANTRAGTINAVIQLICKGYKFLFQIQFKILLVVRAGLVLSGTLIGVI